MATHAPGRSGNSRHLGSMMKHRLSTRLLTLLQVASRLGQERGTEVYAVGGFVRDLLLNRPNLDLDLVVEGDGLAYAAALAEKTGARVTPHARFRTAVLFYHDGMTLDVATARRESYASPAALPTVEASSIDDDLFRRDFTINTLAVRLTGERFGELRDICGGQRDLQDGVIRVLHRRSFIDDPTRVFRAVRFEQRFGFRLSRETRGLIKTAPFERLSADRLRHELMRLLSEDIPSHVAARLGELQLLQVLHSDLGRMRRLPASLVRLLKRIDRVLTWYKAETPAWPRLPRNGATATWLVPLAALLLPLSPRALRETVARLRFSPREATLLRTAHSGCERLLQALDRCELRASQIARLLDGYSEELLLFLLAQARRPRVSRRLTSFLARDRYVRPRVTGRDLVAMGVKPGPRYTRLLERLRAARLDGIVDTDEAERALARKLAAGSHAARPRPAV